MEDANTTGIAIMLVISFIITWAVGLCPPLLLRYVMLKKPMGKRPAIMTCIGLFVANIIIFTLLGSKSKTHGALVLVAFVSYWLLRRATKPEKETMLPIEEKEPQ